jgi:uncharacterized protein (TIGR02598 family)
MFAAMRKPGTGFQVRRQSSGFTLIETVISLPIAAIVLIALYACFTQGFNMVQQSRENLRATQIMIKQLERIRVCSFSQLTNTVYNPQSLTDYFDPADQPTGGGGSTYTVTFTPSVPASGMVPDSYRTNMLLITVGISWTSKKLQHTNFMQTLVAKNGIESYVATGQ